MALDAKGAAALALHRFGMGPRAGSIAAIASDPRGACSARRRGRRYSAARTSSTSMKPPDWRCHSAA